MMLDGAVCGVHGYRPTTYGASFSDVYDDWYSGVSDVDATVTGLTRMAGEGAVLELGIGTGRLALPLRDAGIDVVGIDASAAMVARMHGKSPDGPVPTALGDMAALPFAPGRFAVVFAAFNTFFNLTDETAHRACVADVGRVLTPSGRFVVEGFAPPPDGLSDGGVAVRDISIDAAVLTVSRHDPDRQVIEGHHVQLREGDVRMRPRMLRYLTPAQLDELMAEAGLVLESRHADWTGTTFDADHHDGHVSTYRRDD